MASSGFPGFSSNQIYTFFYPSYRSREDKKTSKQSRLFNFLDGTSFCLDKVDSGIGLSYWPARLHRLAGWYYNPMPESTTY